MDWRSAASTLSQFAPYAALRAFTAIFHSFGADQNLRTASAIGSLYHALNRRRASRAEEHIAMAFPEFSPQRISEVAKSSIENMFRLFLVESVVMPQILNMRSWPRHVEFGFISTTMRQLLTERPTILLTGHCGNWELLGFVLALMGFPMTALARPLDNRFVDRWLVAMRESKGLEILSKWGAADELQRLVKRGRRIGFIADQNAGDDGLFVPFFGRLASSYKSIGLMAMRYELPIYVGIAYRLGETFRYRLETMDGFGPEDWQSQPDPLFYITARFNRAIEKSVRLAPEQYLWIHRRWKSRPRFEREGKPFPAQLREKLQALPWMTSAELERIEHLSESMAPARSAPIPV